jgi:predicted  nucleic acid-binding Zn-ribbon protein
MICTYCLKRVSRKTARILDGVVMCGVCLFKPASERERKESPK